MEKNWVKIYSSTQWYKVQFIKGLLEEQEIENVEINKQDSLYRNTLFGEIELYVSHDNVIKSKYLIERNNFE
jgi:hypothetical protein